MANRKVLGQLAVESTLFYTGHGIRQRASCVRAEHTELGTKGVEVIFVRLLAATGSAAIIAAQSQAAACTRVLGARTAPWPHHIPPYQQARPPSSSRWLHRILH